MEYDRLAQVGHDFDDVNPYGWPGFRTIIRVFAVPVRWLLVWMHENLRLAYGLVLVVFGILVRVVLWPLNQKAMRASMEMQAVQPLMKEMQERYKSDPQRMQQEMFKLYKEHKVNPFGGCWPMLLPMPVLFALFFVFQNTIELRGASFLWLPDLSRPDPLYIIPIVMGASMYFLTKIGQMGMEPNPQMKMMLYMMPADDDGHVPLLPVRAQPVLHGEQHREHSAAVAARPGADEAHRTGHRGREDRAAAEPAAGHGQEAKEGLGKQVPSCSPIPIAALATPPGRSALAVVRLSGAGAFAVAARVIEGFRADRPRTATLAAFRAPTASLIDRGLYTVFPAPHSYTGEDLVELSCHGGLLAPARLLAALHAAGARPAAPGEFTRRAVLNGKLDLVQAEAVGDLIDATAPAQARAALRQLEGGLSRRLGELRETLVEAQALLSYDIDFPGEDDGPVPPERDRGGARGCRRPDRAAARHRAVRRAAAGGRAAGARRPAQRRQVLALQRAARHRAGAGHRDPRHHPRRHRGAHRLSRLAGAAGRHGGLWDSADRLERLGVEVSRRYLAAADLVLLCVEAGRAPGPDEADAGRGAPDAAGPDQGATWRPAASDGTSPSRAVTGEGLDRAAARRGRAGLRRPHRARATWSPASPASGTAGA